jgi:hypothetical protein
MVLVVLQDAQFAAQLPEGIDHPWEQRKLDADQAFKVAGSGTIHIAPAYRTRCPLASQRHPHSTNSLYYDLPLAEWRMADWRL